MFSTMLLDLLDMTRSKGMMCAKYIHLFFNMLAPLTTEVRKY